jgi:hypothetical protein
LDSINNASPSYDYTDEEKYTTYDALLMVMKHCTVGTNGIYGAGSLQMLSSDLVLVYSALI